MLWLIKFLPIIFIANDAFGLLCSRYPANTFTVKSPVDDNLAILVNGNPQTYILGQEYNITLNAFNGLRFVSFMLALENENGDGGYNGELGHFEISDPVETRYSPSCVNMVENTNTNSKTRIDVTWVAPERPGAGCVLLRATVLQHRDVWYMDDGALTRRICEEIVDDVESQSMLTTTTQTCCACDEARYDLIFEGLWSRNLHPKDFPTKGWITRFSDIMGVSHKGDYRFWEYGAPASVGLREYAEHSSSRILEREFNARFKSGDIRTIIKARGPAFPNLNGRTVASVRVDSQHHLISLASKIEPSPDWIVGVSGLELCMANCTWLEQRLIYLYPTDIGTDAGPSYTSPKQPQVPAGVIRPMRSDFPNDPRSPFYDESGAPMKPLAALIVKRQRLYERLCEDEDSNNFDVPRECVTHPWSAWTECSAKCGEGRQYRRRVYKQTEVAKIYNCDAFMTNRQNRSCFGDECAENNELANNLGPNVFPNLLKPDFGDDMYGRSSSRSGPVCTLTDWSDWSECNATCGDGKKWRQKFYVNPLAQEECQRVSPVNLIDYKYCRGKSCSGDVFNTGFSGQQWPNGNFNRNREQWQAEPENSNWNSEGRSPSWDSEPANGNWNFNQPDKDQYVEPYKTINEYDGSERDNAIQNENNNFENELEVGNLRKEFIEPHISQYPQERQTQKRRPSSRNYFEQVSTNNVHIPVPVPPYCFEPLEIFKCLDAKVTGNFWFYNYCRDECMLYASDSCDRNANKFNSLEMCELRCRQPEAHDYLRRKQFQDCHKGATSPRGHRRYK